MTTITIDLSKGFDVMRGKKVVEHFDSYERAWEYARDHRLTLRYWAVQPTKAAADVQA